jgi:hypothetical protein
MRKAVTGRQSAKTPRWATRIANGRLLLAVGLIPVAIATTAVAHADASPTHAVKYIVYSNVPTAADIYFRDTDPPTFADYSHDPYRYSPNAKVDIAPGAPWELDTALANPDQWAMVTVSNGLSVEKPAFRCELLVDGIVAAVNEGPKGALCSLRNW